MRIGKFSFLNKHICIYIYIIYIFTHMQSCFKEKFEISFFVALALEDGLTGSAWGDWSLYTASPLRAFEGELGVQAPVGFWDPAGLSSDGSIENFKRRRAVEIKHGRIVRVLAFSELQCLLKLQLGSTESVVHMMGQSYHL